MIFKKKPLLTQGLGEITRGLHHAAASTSAMLAQQYMHLIKQFFDIDEESGDLQAKMVRVAVDEHHEMNIPLISLVAPKGIALENMKVRLAAKIEDVKNTQATLADNSGAERSSFQVSLSPRTKHGKHKDSELMEIDVEFKATEPPEGMMRVIEEYTRLINPAKKDHQTEKVRHTTVINEHLLGKKLSQKPKKPLYY